jgi:hypothetical protein
MELWQRSLRPEQTADFAVASHETTVAGEFVRPSKEGGIK